jgi:hypothetical protein
VSNRVLPLVNKEKLVIKGISPVLGGYRVVTDLPTPLEPALPLVQVLDAGGTLLDETTVAGRVDVYCLAATRAAMWAPVGRRQRRGREPRGAGNRRPAGRRRDPPGAAHLPGLVGDRAADGRHVRIAVPATTVTR